MTKREKILAAAVLGLLILFGAKSLLGRYSGLVDRRQSQLYNAKRDLADAEMALARGRLAVRKMEAWQEQSLPADRDVAVSLYRSWLLERCKAAGLTVDDVNPDARSARTTAFSSIGYVVEARGSLKSVVSLLYEFYRSAQLQQITRLRLRPSTDPSQLAVSLRVEALILPGATNTDKLSDGTTDRLALASVDEYQKQLVDRNLFVAYTPPQPERQNNVVREQPPAPPKFDAAKHAYVTGIVQTGGKLQAWITVRTTGEVLRLFEGDELKVGLLEGRIVSIAPRMVVLEAGDEQLNVELGHSLREEDQETVRQEEEKTT